MAKISGDTVIEFIEKAHQKFGADDLGETKAAVSPEGASIKDGKVTGLKFTLAVDTDYAEIGSGKPDDANKDAIKKVAAIVKAHEDAHAKGYRKAFSSWNPKKAAKQVMDQTYRDKAEAEKAIDDALEEIRQALRKTCLALHAKEGRVSAEVERDGTIRIIEQPAGSKGCA